YVNKKSSKLFIRYRINGKRRDETIVNLDYYSEPENVKQVKINNKSEGLAQKLVEKKRQELFHTDNGLIYFENQKKSFIKFFHLIGEERGKTKSTYYGYMSSIKKFKLFLDTKGISDVMICQVNYALCDEYKAHLEGRLDIGDTSKQKYFKVFKFVVAQLHNRGYHQKFVAKALKGISGQYQRHDYLTQEEFRLMYDTPTPFMNKTETRRFFIFSCLTGLPHRECTALKWDDFYVETIDDKRTTYFNYKRAKTGKYYKNPISKDAEIYLEILRQTRSCREFVFPNLKYSAHENMKIQTWANMSDVKKKISPHCARATFANLFVRVKGANIMDLKELMGHSDVKTTLSYIGTSLEEKTKAVRNMPTLLDINNTEISMI
ncbi:tyrosine-type recombinase/integrase, partial [bacterium]|nr:tyrosine-type recombinase/integrase [bacterium]